MIETLFQIFVDIFVLYVDKLPVNEGVNDSSINLIEQKKNPIRNGRKYLIVA